ncbi:MAG: hypothetical protein QF472_05565 [Candidatus Marinimicrobia bacterium]|nr:hypothetical protein [Candidatus Neomarinimicrobiota bacterium]MDP6853400.1 hypothetical protein [Candidatus Neomarinimicrobiota bacterium]
MYKFIWLYLSAFGIMFAILSWSQESGLLPGNIGSLKGFLALFTGTALYLIVGKKI